MSYVLDIATEDDMTKPDPTNGWTRGEMVDHILGHLFEAAAAMEFMPDMRDSDLLRALDAGIADLRREGEEAQWWRKRA